MFYDQVVLFLSNISAVITDISSKYELDLGPLQTSLSDISTWDTENVTDMSNLFNECSSSTLLPDISKWLTTSLLKMDNMFKGCSSLISLPDISKWNTSDVNYMNNIFSKCSSLISPYITPGTELTQKILFFPKNIY